MSTANMPNTMRESIKRFLPDAVKRQVRRVQPKTKLQRDLELFVLNGTRFEPPLPDFPPMVMLDTTTRCNLTCEHCPNSALSEDKDFLGDMDDTVLFKCLDEIAAEAPDTLTRLFDGGEPMIRKDLHEHIAYATQRGIRRVSINTNGTMLVAKRRKELIEAGLSHMEVSIDATTPETYLKIRRSPLFDRVVENTLAYIEESKAHDSQNQVTVSFVLQSDNQHEEQTFRDFWEPKVDRVYIREYHQHNDWVDDHGLFKKRGNPHRHPCPFLWNRLIVFHDGRVRFCEFDWRADHPIGDVRTQTLKEIWHSDAFRELRQQHVCGTFEHPFCKSCTDWRQVHWTGLGDDRADNIVQAA